MKRTKAVIACLVEPIHSSQFKADKVYRRNLSFTFLKQYCNGKCHHVNHHINNKEYSIIKPVPMITIMV